MKLFKTTVEALQKQSRDALSVFESTINNLTEINEKIAVEKGYINGAIAILERGVEDLELVASKNALLASKMKSFLEV